MSAAHAAASVRITRAHVARHMPRGARTQGREAALVDIAQDLLLRELHEAGLMSELVFKGGTALRKLYAGNAGRFSLDLDFAVRDVGTSSTDVLDLLEEHVQGLRLGPFEYGIAHRRGKRHLLMRSAELDSPESLSSKMDVSSPPWLEPTLRSWVPLDVHAQYGRPLPQLPVVRLEENLAEKISRLNRGTPARDMYDLRWVAQNLLRANLDPALIRRLAVLKVWVDTHGVTAAGDGAGGTAWLPAHEGGPFDPGRWLRRRSDREYDEEDIGTLAVPAPRLEELSADVSSSYAFLAELDPDEHVVAAARERDRPTVLRLLADLPGNRLAGLGLH
jgi:predicted nucleotidyltransferase component of viral defense system